MSAPYSHMTEWTDLTGEIWDGNTLEGRKAWLDMAGVTGGLYMVSWGDLPGVVRDLLIAEYQDEMNGKYREGYQEEYQEEV